MLWAAVDFVGGDINTLNIRPTNQVQSSFINTYMMRTNLGAFKPHELRSWASTDIAHLNNILTQEGYNIQLQQSGANAFGAVSILDIAVKWQNPTQAGFLALTEDKKMYPVVMMDTNNFQLTYKTAHRAPVAYCWTTTGDIVCMAELNEQEQQLSSSQMLELIDEINNCREIYKVILPYNRLIFPMIKYESIIELDWLQGLGIGGYPIGQAIQQTKFSMDEVGAHAQSACAMTVEYCSRCAPPHCDFVIDKPFLLWIMRPGVKQPIFAAYLPYACWQDPKGN
jgi:hypothetical protein